MSKKILSFLILSFLSLQTISFFHLAEYGFEEHNHSHEHEHEHIHSEEDSKIEDFLSISFQTQEPFSLRKFQYFLDNQLKSNVFRAKGILWFTESERKHVFHLAGKRISIEDSEWGEKRINQIVLIGKELDKEKIM